MPSSAWRDGSRERTARTGYGTGRRDGNQATLSVARLELHEQRLELLRAVQSDAEVTAIYFDTFAGISSVAALYTPRLLALL